MKCLTLVLIAFAVTSSFAQDKLRKFEFGFGGGLNYSFSSTSPSGIQIALPGFNAGLVINYRISNRFFIDTRALFLQQNTKYKGDVFFDSHLEIVNHYSWIAVPFQLNYVLTPKAPSKYFVGFGLAPQRLLDGSAEYKFVFGPLSGGSGVITNNSRLSRVNDWNLIALGQAGVQIPLKQGGKILAMLSFERALVNILKPSSPHPTFDYVQAFSDIKLNSFSLGVTYVY